MSRSLSVTIERFPIAGRFVIARGARTEAVLVVARISEGSVIGQGECVPYARYGETPEGVVAAIAMQEQAIAAGAGREDLLRSMPPGAARNALDCALWDFEAKQMQFPAFRLAGMDRLRPVTTVFTISLDTPQAMAEAAEKAAERPILKIKLGAPSGDNERIRAVRAAAPDTVLLVDANEGWTFETVSDHLRVCAEAGVAVVEQPLPVAEDALLAQVDKCVPLCADESVHAREGMERLAPLYQMVNIKLDKTGGLTEALETAKKAESLGLGIMAGCMVGTSLAMAPAMLLAQRARFVDLDGPLLLAHDREHGLRYDGSVVYPPEPALWG